MMEDLFRDKCDKNVLYEGLSKLGLASEKGTLLFFASEKDSYHDIPDIWFQLEKAQYYKADAVFFKKGLKTDEYIPQIYIYDQTSNKLVDEKELTETHKNVWTGGEVPIVCVFSKTDIKILDTTRPIKEKSGGEFTPDYLVKSLKLVSKVDKIFNENFAQKIKSGTYWDTSKVDFNKSAYKKLTELLRRVINEFTKESGLQNNKEVVQRFIIQCILVKYLEERCDEDNNTVFPASFFQKYALANQFSDVLANGTVFDFFDDLNDNHFNGGIFKWGDERNLFQGKCRAFSYLADVLRGYTSEFGQTVLDFEDNFSRFYSFNYIPVELISRLYEEFIIKENKKKKIESDTASRDELDTEYEQNSTKKENDGVAYTPAHLVRLLVNETMPLNEIPHNLDDFKVLDPACGSAIFLVVAFKRLVQWWRQNNNYKKPELEDLKKLLNSVYGVDLDPKAVQISIFSLCISLCDELSPKEIWDRLKFDPMENEIIFHDSFFNWQNSIDKDLKFDVIIGNPPFVRGGIGKDLNTWRVNESFTIEIPQNQIALKFLSDSLSLLKENGLTCLIVKALPLLYSNSDSSNNYLKALTQNFQLNQIFDFTPLARNGVLWDGADVDTAAIFVTKSKPNFNKNVLHAIFRRTKTNKERIYFEIDKYDLHFILRNEVYEHPYIFKINLLGGGRLNNLVNKCRTYSNITNYLKENNCKASEGFQFGKIENADQVKDFMYEYESLPTNAFKEEYVDFKQLYKVEKSRKFISIKNRFVYEYPNIIIKENIGKNRIPIYFNQSRNFTFKHKLIGIYSLDKEVAPLARLYNSFNENFALYRLFIFITSGQVLISKNTAILKEDIMRLPIFDHSFELSTMERNVINDVLDCTQYFLRSPETAQALKPINDKELESQINFYGKEFSNALNELYADEENSFKLTDIISFGKEGLIGTLFSYDGREDVKPKFRSEKEVTGIDGLTNFDINESLTATRVIQYYAPNKVLFVKPNQKRFWLASIAYRDADSVFADILNIN